MSIANTIRERLVNSGTQFFANDNIADFIEEGELDLLQGEIQEKAKELLQSMVIDIDNDHNTNETAKRIAKMFTRELFKGRYMQKPPVTYFPNAKALDEITCLGPIAIKSSCSHHFLPVIGKVWIGFIPSERVIGISKFARIVDWIASRPHIQEELCIMLADELEELIKPKGLAIIMEATHTCMTMRGVKEYETIMTNSVMRGRFRQEPSLKEEFMHLIKNK